MTVTPSVAQFTAALRLFASGVTVVTIRDELDDLGMTATAFASVSLEPPLVLISVDRASYLDEVLERRDHWAVCILAAGQRPIASRFADAGRPSARLLLADLPHHRGPLTEALIIDDAVAALECETAQRVEAGDHTIVIGRVLAVDYVDDRRTPLLRLAGSYTEPTPR